MLFYSFFKTLTGKEVTVELKNDLSITGILHSVDQYLNIKLNEIKVVDEEKHPHLMAVQNCFIRGSVVRYIQVSFGCLVGRGTGGRRQGSEGRGTQTS
mmetsp:Transcript_11983/g.33151  ORF Transcript_11983/g.33151 Transcript_11983/m.33151 type:complete len:98 (-) Transcript_11983:694-987(-)